MPLHLSSLLGNNVLFHKDERGGKWFCNVSARRDSPWKMRWGICDCEGLLVFQCRMKLPSHFNGAVLPAVFDYEKCKKRILESVYCKVLFQTWFCVHLESMNIVSWSAKYCFWSVSHRLNMAWQGHNKSLEVFTFSFNLFIIFHVQKK